MDETCGRPLTHRENPHISTPCARPLGHDGTCSVLPLAVDQPEPPTPDALTVLRPGDRVLCVFRDADVDHVHNGLEQMRLRFPDVEFSALVGADQVLVQPSEEPTDA